MTDTPWEVAMLRIAFSDHDIEQLRYERYTVNGYKFTLLNV